MMLSTFTHFIVGDALCRCFQVEHCDRCGCDIEAANSSRVMETRETLLEMGLIELPKRLPELLLAEHLGGICVCPECYGADGVDSLSSLM